MFQGQDLSLSSDKNISATPNQLVPTGKTILNLWETHVFSTGTTYVPNMY